MRIFIIIIKIIVRSARAAGNPDLAIYNARLISHNQRNTFRLLFRGVVGNILVPYFNLLFCNPAHPYAVAVVRRLCQQILPYCSAAMTYSRCSDARRRRKYGITTAAAPSSRAAEIRTRTTSFEESAAAAKIRTSATSFEVGRRRRDPNKCDVVRRVCRTAPRRPRV